MKSIAITKKRTGSIDAWCLLEKIGGTAKGERDSSFFAEAKVDTTHERKHGSFVFHVNQGGIQNRRHLTRHEKDTFKDDVLPGLIEEYPELAEHFPDLLHFTGKVVLHFHEWGLQKAEFHPKAPKS